MRIAGIDIETTGLDFRKDHVTEVAWIIKDVGDPKPMAMRTHFILPPEDFFGLTPEIEQLTKIQMKHLKTGIGLRHVLAQFAEDLNYFAVDAICGHNGEGFDKPFLFGKAEAWPDDASIQSIFSKQWVDSAVDCVYPSDCRYTNLMYVAAYFGILNFFPHSALFDVATMLRVLDQFDFGKVLERAKTPWVYVQAEVSFADKDKAKARRYVWEKHGDRVFPKTWIKRIKESELEKERAEAGFPVLRCDI